MDVEVDGAHKLSQSQSGGQFGKLGRLEFEGAKIDPREATVGSGTYKESGDKEQNEQAVEGISGMDEEARLDIEHHDSKDESGGDPDKLFAVLDREIEDSGMDIVVASGIDIDPTETHDKKIEKDRNPIDLTGRDGGVGKVRRVRQDGKILNG